MKYSLSRFYTGLIILLPIANIYKSFIPSVEFGTLLTLIFMIIVTIKGNYGRIGKDWVFLAVIATFYFGTFASIVILENNLSYELRYFFRLLKVTVIGLCITIWGKEYFNLDIAKRTLTRASIICSIFIFIQYILFYAGVRIDGVIRSLAAVQDDTIPNIRGMFRPASFFLEPSHFAMYQLVFLCFLLVEQNIRHKKIYFLITLLGIFLSTSGTGYILTLLLLVLAPFISPVIRKNMTLKNTLLITIIIGAFITLLTTTEIGQESINRFLNSDGTMGGAATGRLESGADTYFMHLSPKAKVWGMGFGYRPDDVYFSSIYAILYGDGYVGLASLLLMMLYYFRKSRSFGKLLCITYSVLFIGTGVFNFSSIALYFSLISADLITSNIPNTYDYLHQ